MLIISQLRAEIFTTSACRPHTFALLLFLLALGHDIAWLCISLTQVRNGPSRLSPSSRLPRFLLLRTCCRCRPAFCHVSQPQHHYRSTISAICAYILIRRVAYFVTNLPLHRLHPTMATSPRHGSGWRKAHAGSLSLNLC
jgi:hypothetical protein